MNGCLPEENYKLRNWISKTNTIYCPRNHMPKRKKKRLNSPNKRENKKQKYLPDKRKLLRIHLCQALDTCEKFCTWFVVLLTISTVNICASKYEKSTNDKFIEYIRYGLGCRQTSTSVFEKLKKRMLHSPMEIHWRFELTEWFTGQKCFDSCYARLEKFFATHCCAQVNRSMQQQVRAPRASAMKWKRLWDELFIWVYMQMRMEEGDIDISAARTCYFPSNFGYEIVIQNI